jgi:hypothetical protein
VQARSDHDSIGFKFFAASEANPEARCSGVDALDQSRIDVWNECLLEPFSVLDETLDRERIR